MVIAKVTFLGPQRGGRYTSPISGFHPQIKLGEIHASCIVKAVDNEVVFEFDKEYLVSLDLMYREYINLLTATNELRLYEGSKLVGIGIIVQRK